MKQPLAANHDFAGSPVDVIELESRDLTAAETETGEQKKDGVVAAAVRRATVAGLQHAFDFLWGQVLGPVDSRRSATVGTEAAKSAWSSPF
jgi:hypothetical protein